jgi:hypothetical protein
MSMQVRNPLPSLQAHRSTHHTNSQLHNTPNMTRHHTCRIAQPNCLQTTYTHSPVTHLDLGPECIWVALQNCLHCRLPDCLVVLVVETAQAVAVVTVPPTGKALTVAAGTHAPAQRECEGCVVCAQGGGEVKWLSMQGCGRAACQAGSSSSLCGHSHDHVDHQLLCEAEKSLGVVQEECSCACACGDCGMQRPGGSAQEHAVVVTSTCMCSNQVV